MYLPRILLRLPLLIIACCLLWGCSTLNVRHLSPTLWQADTPAQVTLKFWTVEYICEREANQFTITGRALPRVNLFPTWSAWMSEMELTAYVCDPQGKVLVRKTAAQESAPFPPPAGIPFTFTLETGTSVNNPAITFGYRMIILPAPPSPETTYPLASKNTQIFFASQEALRQ